jgi:hypothetical protein
METGDFGRSLAGAGCTGLSRKSFDGFCGFERIGAASDVPAVSDVDFGAPNAAFASEFSSAVCLATCKEAPCCRMFEYLKVGTATAQEARIPNRAPRMNCHRIAERCRSKGTSLVMFDDSGAVSVYGRPTKVMMFECLSQLSAQSSAGREGE